MPEIRKEICPICSSALKCGSRRYSLRELLELWKPVQFSENVAKELSKQANSTQLFICPECDFEIFLPPIIGPPEFYSQLSRHETLHYYEEEKWEFGEALKDLGRDASVIEMGCGSGSFLRKISPFVSEVCGIESNDHALAAARNAGLNVLANGGDLTQLKMRFDYAFCFHVLEHVADPVEFLKDLSLLVKPGGRIGLSVPNQDGPVKYINPCIQNMPPHHATRWHAKTLRFLARKLSFNIEKIAQEPVTLGSHYYYSTHWVNHIFSNQSIRGIFFRSMLQRALSSSFEAIFKFLSVFNIRSLRLLKGQSMYVLLSSSKGKCF
jgi:2-polyprenyl-3-methyl-5-hydroxy-6-metoxy-1,4-benzoquinol methylase